MRRERPLWRETQRRVRAWRELGVSDYLCRAVQFGIYDQPVTPFQQETAAWLPEIPQTADDRAYAEADLAEGCRTGLYEEVTMEHARRAYASGSVISSAFTVWQEKDGIKKGRFVINLSKQSKHWKKGSVRMENLAEFAMTLQKGDHMLSMDIYQGYRAFRIHPAMRDWFIFHYNGRFYRCVSLPFGWGRSPLWFTHLMAPLVQEMRKRGWRILHYIDDFLVVPTPYGTVSTPAHCLAARPQLDSLLTALGLRRHQEKGEWEGATVVDHLGVIVDTNELKFYVRPDKARKIEVSAKRIMKTAMLGRRWVPVAWLTSFCGTCVSLSLAMPWARFYTRSLYSDMSISRPRDARGRCRLSHQSLRDLKFWKTLCRQDLQGRLMQPVTPHGSMHSDAADMGYGGTLHDTELRPGRPGLWCAQGVWSWEERAKSITLRELRAVRKLLMGALGSKITQRGMKHLRLYIDNQAVVHVANSMVSASPGLMRELRRLKVLLDRMGISIRAEWLPSALNRFADALSRRFPRGDLQIRQQLRRSVLAGMKAPIDAFRFRPLGESPWFARRQAYKELAAEWRQDEVRLLCPPIDLLNATVMKLAQTKAPAMLIMPHWPRQPWHQAAIRMSSKVTLLNESPQEIWMGQRTVNPAWQALLLEVNIGKPDQTSVSI